MHEKKGILNKVFFRHSKISVRGSNEFQFDKIKKKHWKWEKQKMATYKERYLAGEIIMVHLAS